MVEVANDPGPKGEKSETVRTTKEEENHGAQWKVEGS